MRAAKQTNYLGTIDSPEHSCRHCCTVASAIRHNATDTCPRDASVVHALLAQRVHLHVSACADAIHAHTLTLSRAAWHALAGASACVDACASLSFRASRRGKKGEQTNEQTAQTAFK